MLWTSAIHFSFFSSLFRPTKTAARGPDDEWGEMKKAYCNSPECCWSRCGTYPRHPGAPRAERCLTSGLEGGVSDVFSGTFSPLLMAAGQLLSASHCRWKLKLPRPGLRPFDGVLLAGNGGLKRSDAVNSHSYPDVLMGHGELSLIFREELSFFQKFVVKHRELHQRICSGHGAGQRGGVENEEKHFQCVSSCSAQVCVTPTKARQKPPNLQQDFPVVEVWGCVKNKIDFAAFGMKRMEIWKDFHVITADITLSARGTTPEARELRIRSWFIGFECKQGTLVLKSRRYGRLLLTSMNLQNWVCKCRRLWNLPVPLLILQPSAVIWISKSKLQCHVESILIRKVAAFLSLLQFGIHEYFRVEKNALKQDTF